MAMLPAVVVVKAPSGMMQNGPPEYPTGIPKPVMAAVPLTWNSGPVGVIGPAVDATAGIIAGGIALEPGLPHPGTHTPDVEVTPLHRYWYPVTMLTYGSTSRSLGLQAPEGSLTKNQSLFPARTIAPDAWVFATVPEAPRITVTLVLF